MKPLVESLSHNLFHRAALPWLDGIKGLAILWIILNHLAERTFGYPYIANPDAHWPDLTIRMAQLRSLSGYGLWDIPLNLFRYIGWFGDQGVTLFLIAGGFALTWAVRNLSLREFSLTRFYLRRFIRLYPEWWGAHALFLLSALLVGWGLSPFSTEFVLSVLGLRFSTDSFYFFSPAWWYFTLAVQLSLIFPFLWRLLHRIGPQRFLLGCCAVAFSVRAIGLMWCSYYLPHYLDPWSRGIVFISRLPEFAFGMVLSEWFSRSPQIADDRLRSGYVVAGSVVIYLLGTVLSITLLGMTVASFLQGAGLFVFLYWMMTRSVVAVRDSTIGHGFIAWCSKHSYAIYLVHHPFILRLVPSGTAAGVVRIIAGIVAALFLTLVCARMLEKGVALVQRKLSSWSKAYGKAKVLAVVVLLAVLSITSAVGCEMLVRLLNPQEVLGWGERPSLEPHPLYGWRLKPSQTTRLRWQSYDYTVRANSLGFPGPEYAPDRPPGTFRILVTGDAFSSAEGVDTERAWPRLLEAELQNALPGRKIEVMNFAITGYGPNQYAAVIRHFTPVYRPDLILVEMFVNDYEDVAIADDGFLRSIGFDERSQSGWYSIATLAHLRQLLELEVREPVREIFSSEIHGQGYFLGNFKALERGPQGITEQKRKLVLERMREIKQVSVSNGTRVMVIMVPAPVQVCSPANLAYWPRNISLTDSSRFDPDRPQRVTQAIAAELQFSYYDLRPILTQAAMSGDCPYQRRNMHWTASGHSLVAAQIARRISTELVADETR